MHHRRATYKRGRPRGNAQTNETSCNEEQQSTFKHTKNASEKKKRPIAAIWSPKINQYENNEWKFEAPKVILGKRNPDPEQFNHSLTNKTSFPQDNKCLA